MDKSGKNKENKISRNMSITDVFKVKKCLFDSKSEFTSPNPTSSVQSCSPNLPNNLNESPFSMFQFRKRRSVTKSPNEETPFPLFQFRKRSLNKSPNDETPHKRSLSSGNKEITQFFHKTDVAMGSPESSRIVKIAVQKAMTESNLIGDFSKPCLLPIIQGKHQDLKTVSPQTLADILRRHRSLSFRIIDCRYPYEFKGGHIKNATNIYLKEVAKKDFFPSAVTAAREEKNDILIFYCEFSSERAPSMMRFLRNTDRDLNEDCYPFLFYPELYLLEGGYKEFFASFRDLCVPKEYKSMLDRDCSQQMSFYRSECKKFSGKSKRIKRAKTLLF